MNSKVARALIRLEKAQEDVVAAIVAAHPIGTIWRIWNDGRKEHCFEGRVIYHQTWGSDIKRIQVENIRTGAKRWSDVGDFLNRVQEGSDAPSSKL